MNHNLKDNKKQYLLFDLDGTLTDSMPGITRAVQYALNRYGIQVDDLSQLKPFVGPPLADSFQEFYQFERKDAEDAVGVFREYYTDRGWLENAPYDGIREALQTLRDSGKKLYVATSKPEWMAKMVLKHFELDGFFEFIGGADDDEKRVNKDDVIRYVLASCGLEQKDAIVMVGDRRHDINGAHRTGLQAVGVLYGYGDREELSLAGAEWITETPATLCELLLRL